MPLAMLLLLYVTTLTSPGPSVNGVKIVTRLTGGFTDTRTEYLAADRLRNEWQSQMRDGTGPAMATIILRGDRDRVFVLDLTAREYATYETDSRATTVGIKPRPMVDSGGTLQIWIENIDTGERKELFGHIARHIITREKRIAGPRACSKPSMSESNGWYIDGPVMPEWRQQKKTNYGVVVSTDVAVSSNDKCFNKTDKIELHRTGVETGFPVKVTTTMQSEITQSDGSKRMMASTWGSEVVEMKEGPLELSLFDVPKDFQRVETLRSWTAKPPRQQTGWEWFKEKVQDLFR
jgi:hypothetical protein